MEDDPSDQRTTTATRLLDVAESLFASSGITSVTTREITEAADQKNTSAVSYHFGTREGLLIELLKRRGGPIDLHRGEMRALVGNAPSINELVTCLVTPYVSMLLDQNGRHYVQIVDQLRGRFAAWRVESDAETSKSLRVILDEIATHVEQSEPVRNERVVALIMLMTSVTAERARAIEQQRSHALSDEEFEANVVSMCSAVILAE